MAAKKKPSDKSGERYRKPRKMAGVPARVASVIEHLAQQNETDFTEQVKRLLIEALERRELWPPPEAD